MMALFISLCLALLPLSLKSEQKTFHFDFLTSSQGWKGDFADYDRDQENFFELAWGWANLPNPLQLEKSLLAKGMLLSGNNRSDDLFMFIKKQIKGLRPFTQYALYFLVTIENNVPPGLIGIGGSPGESVFFKVGAAKKEPRKILKGSIYRLNVDKGNQSQGGKNAVVVGNLANPLVDPRAPTYQPKTFLSSVPLKVKTDAKGRLWLFVGTDSGFEGLSHYYIASIQVKAHSTEVRNLD